MLAATLMDEADKAGELEGDDGFDALEARLWDLLAKVRGDAERGARRAYEERLRAVPVEVLAEALARFMAEYDDAKCFIPPWEKIEAVRAALLAAVRGGGK